MLLILLGLAPIIPIYFLIIYLRNSVIQIKCLRSLPGPSSNRLFGNVTQQTPEIVFKLLRQWALKWPVYGLNIFHFGTANITNPYDFETVLSSTKHNQKSPVYRILHGWLGTGLLTSYGPKWHHRRKILTPAFHFNILQHFIASFVEETDRLVAVLKKETHKPSTEISEHISNFALNTIGATAMGFDFTEQAVKGAKYKSAIYQLENIYFYKLFRPWFWYDCLYFLTPSFYHERTLIKSLHKFTTNVITTRNDNFKPTTLNCETLQNDDAYSKRKRLALLDLLLTTRNEEHSIDDVGIREEVDTFMFEGHDTTSVALSFALMLIACHKDIQEQLVEEIRHVLGDQKPNYTNLNKMKYLERCIKETLRLYPSVHFIARYLGEDIVTNCGHLLKVGSMVQLHIYDLHHDPILYPDPEKFDPDRFLPKNSKDRHPFAYLPFSAGPRNCIGQKFAMFELKAAICGILLEFILEPVDTPETIVLLPEIMLRSRDGVKVKFISRRAKVSE